MLVFYFSKNEGLVMTFPRSKTMIIACGFASSLFLLGCSSKEDKEKQAMLTASAPATGEASTLTERNAQNRLIQKLTAHFATANLQVKILGVKATEVPNLYWVELENQPAVFATADGQYIIQGDIIRLGQKELSSVNQELQSAANKKLLAQLNPKDLIIYPAQGQTKHIIYVFTDVSCPYCHKLHEDLPNITAKGIEVRYIAWPRGEQFIPNMESVWCSADRKAAFDQAIKDQPIAPATCVNPVRAQYQLGLSMGVNGTPAIYSEDGQYLGGYLTANEILEHLKN